MSNKEILIDLIKRAQGDRSQNQFASQCDISSAALTRYTNGERSPTPDILRKIAMKARDGITYQMLMNAAGYLSDHDIKRDFKHTDDIHVAIRIPILGHIPAGVPLEMIEDVLDFEELNTRQFNSNKEWFGLRVKGDSMSPKYLEGDNIIIEKRSDCENGNDCVVVVNGNDATLKRIFKNESGITLQPLNPIYPATYYGNKQIKEYPILILGVVKEIRRLV